MTIRKELASTLVFSAILAIVAIVNVAHADGREEGRLFTAAGVLDRKSVV